MKYITSFFSLTFTDKMILMKLFLYILRAEVIFRVMPYSTSRRLIFEEVKLRRAAPENQLSYLYKYTRLLGSLCKHLPWKPACLRLSIALRDALKTKGIHSVVKIGVCHKDNQLLAHAWLECGGIEVLKNGVYSELTIGNGGCTYGKCQH